MNTPKGTPRLLYTRSQNSKAINNNSVRKIGQNSNNDSTQKHKEINYKTTINKFLLIGDYKKFIQFASMYIDRSILQCDSQPHRLSTIKDIGNYLISDGIFVRKLASLSPNPILVVNHFMKYVRLNKKKLVDFYQNLNKSKDGGENNEFWQEPQKKVEQTEQQRQFRLLGYSKSKKKNDQQKKQRKVYFEEYIKSNRKSYETFLRIKKQKQENKKDGASPQRQSLKRNDIYDKYKQERLVKQITSEVLERMSPTQQQILKKFPTLKRYIDKCKIKSIVIIDELGQLNSYKFCSVGIQFQDPFFQYDRDQLDNRIIIEKALMIEKQAQNNGDIEMKDKQFIEILIMENQLQTKANEEKLKQ